MKRTRDLARTRDRILKAHCPSLRPTVSQGRVARKSLAALASTNACSSTVSAPKTSFIAKFSGRSLVNAPPSMSPFRAVSGGRFCTDQAFSSDLEWVRLLEWEALGNGSGELVGEQERRQYLERTLASLRRAQTEGLVPKNLDLAQLQISIIALTAFPLAFPQMTRLASGLAPT